MIAINPFSHTDLQWIALRLIFVFSLLVLVFACGQCAGMVLELHSAKTEYLLDEPLSFVIALRNDSDRVIEHPVFFDLDEDYLTLYVIDQYGQTTRWLPSIHVDVDRDLRSGKMFAPGESVSNRLWISPGIFTSRSKRAKDGSITLFARYALPKGYPGGALSLRSADIKLKIKQPEGNEQKAHDILCADTTVDPWVYLPEQKDHKAFIARCARLVQQYPTSVYALYAQSRYLEDLNWIR